MVLYKEARVSILTEIPIRSHPRRHQKENTQHFDKMVIL